MASGTVFCVTWGLAVPPRKVRHTSGACRESIPIVWPTKLLFAICPGQEPGKILPSDTKTPRNR